MATKQKPPCPLCGSPDVAIHWSGSGVGGQMLTVTAFASCEECHTVFRDVAGSTAGFTLRECWDRLEHFAENVAHMKAARVRPASPEAMKQDQGE